MEKLKKQQVKITKPLDNGDIDIVIKEEYLIEDIANKINEIIELLNDK